jgi:hypothetical protein
VQDAVSVGDGEGARDADGDEAGDVGRQRACLQQVSDGEAVDVFEGEPQVAAVFEQVVHTRDAFVAQARHCLAFAREAFGHRGGFGGFVVGLGDEQSLERDGPRQTRVGAEEDLAHAAFSEHAVDVVPADFLGNRRHGLRLAH